jgi:hypothetical protein
MIVLLVWLQHDAIFEFDGSKVKVGRKSVRPPLEFRRRGDSSTGRVDPPAVFGFAFLYQMIKHERPHELKDIVQAQGDSANLALGHFVQDLLERTTLAIVHAT